jgi:hypothetical protein
MMYAILYAVFQESKLGRHDTIEHYNIKFFVQVAIIAKDCKPFPHLPSAPGPEQQRPHFIACPGH